MVYKKSPNKVVVKPTNMLSFHCNSLFICTVLTFVVVLAIYLGTKDWKGFTTPEEVDLGVVRVPTHMCRRKHRHSD